MTTCTTGTCAATPATPPPTTSRLDALKRTLASIDWQRVFIFAVVAVNVLAVCYALSKVMAAYAIGGTVYALVTGGTTLFYLLFFAAFACVMVRRYDTWAMFATVMAILCAFVI